MFFRAYNQIAGTLFLFYTFQCRGWIAIGFVVMATVCFVVGQTKTRRYFYQKQ